MATTSGRAGDMIEEAVAQLRQYVPHMDRAWYAAQHDAMRADPNKQDVYERADATAATIAVALEHLAQEAVLDIEVLDIDPSDRDTLRHHTDQPAVVFYLACYDAVATFRYWQDEGDFVAQLDKVELAGTKWLNPASGPELKEAKARAAKAELAQRGQQRGNTARRSDAKARAAGAWAVFGLDGPSGPSLLARVKKATPEQQAALAKLYDYGDDVDGFVTDTGDKNSSVRAQMRRDNKR